MWNSTATPPTQSLGHLQNEVPRINFLIEIFWSGTGVRCSRSDRAVSNSKYFAAMIVKLPDPVDSSCTAI
jgi:hypothetical protein